MRARLPKILVTGGAGFIGSAFAREAAKKGYRIVVADKLTYAGDLNRLKEIKGKYKFYQADICSREKMENIFRKEQPQLIAHFAAETHVDKSIVDPLPFIETNVRGTQVLLDVARKYKIKKFIHISSDEVYGDIIRGEFSENSRLAPSSPYAASKAAADLLLKSYIRTYQFPGLIVRPSNNYGPWQYPEKLIPLAVLKILRNESIPVYAKGRNTREWLYVEDCARAILAVLEKAGPGKVYNIGSGREEKNVAVVKMLLGLMNANAGGFELVKDRPGHDMRYRLNSEKIMQETGWRPKVNFAQGLRRTVHWCIANKKWLLSKGENID